MTGERLAVTHPPMFPPLVASRLSLASIVLGFAFAAPACGATETSARHHEHRHGAHEPTHHRRADASRRRAVRLATPSVSAVAVAPKTVPPAPTPATPTVGRSTGLPIPRFAALRADAVNLRAGPGEQYPILWVFKHQGMPVEIDREYDVWRLVTAPDGTKGWVHQATLIGSRTFFVPAGTATLTLRAAPDESSAPRAILKSEVIGRLTACSAGSTWCRVTVHGIDGFLPREAIWGLLPREVIGAAS